MKRYEPIFTNSNAARGPASDHVMCKNHYTLLVANSKFITPVFFSDGTRHQEKDIY